METCHRSSYYFEVPHLKACAVNEPLSNKNAYVKSALCTPTDNLLKIN